MSGGRWGYLGAQLRHAAMELEAEVEDGGRSLAVTCKLAEAAVCLRRAAVYEERCDWLLSCDDGPETFSRSLAKELHEVGGDEWSALYREVQRLRHELDMAQALVVRYRAALYEINKQFRSDDVMSIEAALSAVEEVLDNA